MRFGDVGERQLSLDRHGKDAGCIRRKQVRCTLAQLGCRRNIVCEVRARKVYRPGFGELERLDRCDQSGRPAVVHAQAPPCEAADAARDRVAPDRVVDDVDAASAGQPPHLVAEVHVAIENHVVRPAFARNHCLFPAAHGRDHRRATQLRQLDQQLADATGTGVDQTGLSRTERVR
jgi:hypothetical protein